MSERLLIVVTNSNPRSPYEISQPIYNATVAASMDYHVELIFSGKAGEILVKGVAETVPSMKNNDKTVYDLICDAHEAGVLIKASKTLISQWGNELIPEVDDIIGAGYMISEIMGHSTQSLSY